MWKMTLNKNASCKYLSIYLPTYLLTYLPTYLHVIIYHFIVAFIAMKLCLIREAERFQQLYLVDGQFHIPLMGKYDQT